MDNPTAPRPWINKVPDEDNFPQRHFVPWTVEKCAVNRVLLHTMDSAVDILRQFSSIYCEDLIPTQVVRCWRKTIIKSEKMSSGNLGPPVKPLMSAFITLCDQ